MNQLSDGQLFAGWLLGVVIVVAVGARLDRANYLKDPMPVLGIAAIWPMCLLIACIGLPIMAVWGIGRLAAGRARKPPKPKDPTLLAAEQELDRELSLPSPVGGPQP